MSTASAYAIRAEPPSLEDDDGGELALDDEELERLNDALDEAEAEYQRGEFVPVEFVLKELRGNVSGR